ncbi:MAG: bifunctional glutamate N-acetyltransferase/amino-acid acetyltransferase ArgJ [Lachnospiraceae bacterium]|nr:bifunctional glutamate N-acetyltransferase/amino-acid acetyltransferase ArgJ [Lachnospiraceae bacterium]
MFQKQEGGVVAAKGFYATGLHAGIKKVKKDMALIYSDAPCAAAGTFTTNIVKAAPVKWDMAIVHERRKAQAIVINSGIANTCTGAQGMEYCRQMAEKTAGLLALQEEDVLVASTGIIGRQLPMDKVTAGIEHMVSMLGNTLEDGTLASEAILTTDTYPKTMAFSFEIEGKTVTLGGISKGSGMVHPNMCTVLSFLTTDLNISAELLQEALLEDVKVTYNMISVDGDTSTNDSVLLLANGKAGNRKITEKNADYELFCKALNKINVYFSKRIAGDGEGSTSLLEAKVVGAKSKEEASVLARSMVSSILTKTAITGRDANWGRFLCAMGYSGIVFEPENVDLYFASKVGKVQVVSQGMAAEYSEEEATQILSAGEVSVIADMHMGESSAAAWGCDLTHEFVKINAEYRKK